MSNGWLSSFCKQGKPYMGVLFLQLGYAINGILVKSALNEGLNPYTFSVYRNVVAAVAFGPFALYFERKIRTQMTFSVFWKILLLAFIEPVMDQILYYTGMKYTTATFAIAMCNVLPALTFVMAWIFRLEKVNVRKVHSQGKILGTLITVGGAMVMTLVNGPPVPLPWTKGGTGVHNSLDSSATVSQDQHIKGAIMITAGCFCWASFYILQAMTLKEYPAQLSLTTLICMMGALQGTVVTLVIEKAKSGIWSMHKETELVATLYSGIVRSGASYYVSGLVMKEKGPFFVTAFNPLGMVIVAIVSSFALAERLVLGRVVGAFIIVVGLYLIIWGKSKDSSLSSSKTKEIETSDIEKPYLETCKDQDQDGTKARKEDDRSEANV
ncbi:WAT1-related protein At2g39510-like [Cynara cardunculus var. scolymus]|uniref:WAT1-related protein n=1 Tax=Cynara cardunculus var. scolymus TaxID=59895 RepID=A0A103Y9E7_CYNCS|nr:WAT1-related protein At2g39510-like [Cynara cardunculus var. scolymus]KVI04947.1 Drug/metabolite transporter [Cynara cardunculus var. scolymus]